MKFNNKSFRREFIHKGLLGLFIFLFSYQHSNAQWKKILQVPNGINAVYFKEFSFIPSDGFVSMTDYGIGGAIKQKLWRTIDGGKTWTQSIIPIDKMGGYTSPACFTFKNPNQGWCCDFTTDDAIFETFDGGTTWSQIDTII